MTHSISFELAISHQANWIELAWKVLLLSENMKDLQASQAPTQEWHDTGGEEWLQGCMHKKTIHSKMKGTATIFMDTCLNFKVHVKK